MLARARAALRYLRLGRAPHRWKVRRGSCPLCRGKWFLLVAPTPFHTRCLKCAATAMNLSPLPVVMRHFGGNYAGKSAYEMSTYGALHDFLARNFASFACSEYFPGEKPGALVGGVRNEDATRLTFADASLDLVTSNQVFEHIEQDITAFAEAYRVLKPGGALIFTIPLYELAATEQLARIDTDGRLQWLGKPEYHDSRSGGPMSAPVFWRHSRSDIVARLRRAGFRQVTVEDVRLLQSQEIAQPVIYARKDPSDAMPRRAP